jgi:hypothetical protein
MIQPASIRGPARHVRLSAAVPDAAPELDIRLRHLAFHGHAAHVRALFGNMTPVERAQHADPRILREAARGSLARVHTLPEGNVFEARQERGFLESIVRLFVSDCCRRGSFPRELFRTLLDWAEDLARASRLAESHEAGQLALTLGVAAFPDIWPWIQLQSARAPLLLGDVEGAYSALLATCRRGTPDRAPSGAGSRSATAAAHTCGSTPAAAVAPPARRKARGPRRPRSSPAPWAASAISS